MQDLIIGMAWYKRDDYERLKEVFEDGDDLQDTFDEWLRDGERATSTLRKAALVVRAYIDPETFPEWCRERDLKIDSHARSRFANDFVKEQSERRSTKKRKRRLR